MGRKNKKNTKSQAAPIQPQAAAESKPQEEVTPTPTTAELSKSARRDIAELITQLLEGEWKSLN